MLSSNLQKAETQVVYTKELVTVKSLYNDQSVDYGNNFCLNL